MNDTVRNEGKREALFFTKFLHALGVSISPSTTLLDFGCGAGGAVLAHRANGIQAFGTDVVEEFDAARTELGQHVFKIAPLAPYQIPFPSEMFDVVISDQVLEHVQDHQAAFTEIARVLKSGGVSAHIFPTRWSLLERHTFIPFGGVFRPRWWLTLWALCGVRNSFQKGMSWTEVVHNNTEYLATGVNYLTRQQLLSGARQHFADARFVESTLLGLNRRPLIQLLSRIPLVGGLYGMFRANALFLRGPKK